MGEFKYLRQGFDAGLALEMGKLVVVAYEQFKIFRQASAPWQLPETYELLREFSAKPPGHGLEKFGFVARRRADKQVYVIFRGTVSPGDWLADLDFVQVKQKNGWGYAEVGFSEIYKGCSESILAALRDAGSPKHVFVSGHSLGGALSTLCAADIKASTGAATSLYTFASPRTGDRTFAEKFNDQCPDTFRIVNTEDIVNTVPLAATAIAEFKLSGLFVKTLSLMPLMRPLKRIQSLFSGLNYQHVGTPVDFTVHKGNIVDNHAMDTYISAFAIEHS
jgi:hypothetical protein